MTHTTRTIIVLFFILAGLGILWLYFFTPEKNTISSPNATSSSQSKTDSTLSSVDSSMYVDAVKNTIITVPDTDVTLSLVDGRASYGTLLDGGDVTLVNVIGAEKITGKTYAYADIAVQSGGTGVFHYVALFDVSSNKARYLSSYFIGDRVVLSAASSTPRNATSYTLSVRYLDRADGEAMASEPTVSKEIQIEVKNNQFVQPQD